VHPEVILRLLLKIGLGGDGRLRDGHYQSCCFAKR
jgi:hypothetical protein